MKRKFFLMLSLIILTIASASCDNTDKGDVTDKMTGSDKTSSMLIETSPTHYFYSFESYNDLQRALKMKDTEEYVLLRTEQTDCGKVYRDTLSGFANGNIKVAVPQLDGNHIDIRNRDGYTKVTLMTCELYNLPWVWYHCVVDDYELRIQVSYTKVLGDAGIDPKSSYREVLSVIAPNAAPSPDNYHQYESYKFIYEKELFLANDVTVTAMISELKDSSKVYVMINYDGMLTVLYADKELFSDAFWNSFSFDFL